MMKSVTKNCLMGVTATLLAACSYNSLYEPWFDEDVPLYEQAPVIDVTGQQPPVDTSADKAPDNIFIADESLQDTFVANPVNESGVIIKEEETFTEIVLPLPNNDSPSVSFVASYIPYNKDSSKLDSKDRKSVKETAEICKEYKCQIRIIAYASVKNKDYKTLAEKRVDVIKKALIKQGIAENKIITEAGLAKNVGDFAEILVEY